jgi:hypothetical protein
VSVVRFRSLATINRPETRMAFKTVCGGSD